MSEDRVTAKKQLSFYLAVTFGVTWIMELILIILDKNGVIESFPVLYVSIMSVAVFGPGIGAYVAWKTSGEISGFRGYLKKEFCGGKILSAVITIISTMATMLIINYLTVPRSEESWYMFIVYIPYMIFGGGFEELGWRGFLHPFLKKKFSFAVSVIVVSVIWTVWHLPLWFVSSTAQSSENPLSFFVLCICLSVVLAVVYEISGNVIACILIHAWSNVLFAMFVNTLTEFSFSAVYRFVILAVIAVIAYIQVCRRNV